MFMKSATAAIVLATSATVAIAADPAPIDPPVVVDTPQYDWSGVYVGAHAGGAIDGSFTARFPGGALGSGIDGFLGGVHVGYNFQVDRWVIGAEADVSFGDVTGAVGPITNFSVDTMASVRARLGYAFDNILPYATAGVGFAWADQLIPALGSPSNTHVGLVVGGGVEWAFSEQLIGRIEYLYHDYGTETYVYPPGAVVTDFDMHVIRAGLTWKFGDPFR